MATASKQSVVHVRWVVQRDLDEVLAIERQQFEYPWSKKQFFDALTQRNIIGMVAERGDRIVGFMIYELHKTRLHVLDFAVAPQWKRCGVGRAMADTLKGKLSSERRCRILLEVRDSNLEAQCFFRAMGFKAVSVLRDFYDRCNDDAYRFEYRVE